MKKTVMLLAILFSTIASHAQDQIIPSLEIGISQRTYRNAPFYSISQFPQLNFILPQKTVNIVCPYAWEVNRFYDFYGDQKLKFMIAENVGTNHGPELKLGGWSYGFEFGRDALGKKDKVDLLLGLGFDFGRATALQWDGAKMRNSILNSIFHVTPRFQIGKLSMALKATYALDLSKKQWKSYKRRDSFALPNFDQTALEVMVSVGYVVK